MAFLRIAVGDLVTSCLIIHVFAVELAGSYLGHVPCKFWKVCIGLSIFSQINYGVRMYRRRGNTHRARDIDDGIKGYHHESHAILNDSTGRYRLVVPDHP